MNNKNTMSLSSYIFEHLYWGFFVSVWYRCLLFRSIKHLTLQQSKLVFWGILLVSVVAGFLITHKRRRNSLSVCVNYLLALEIYTLLTYSNVLTRQIYAGLAFTVALSTAYIFMVAGSEITNPRRKARIILNRIKACILGTRTITACSMSLVVIPLAASVLLGWAFTGSSVSATLNKNDNTWTISNNIEQICGFYEDNWDKLSDREKTSAMQVVANIESRYLGLPHELNVAVIPLDEFTLGEYDDKTHTIRVNLSHFESDSPSEILNTLCHEAYHAYQHRLCDAYDSVSEEYRTLIDLSVAGAYKKEFSSYTSGEDDFSRYYFQQCEHDARKYAYDSADDYLSRIYDHLGIDTGDGETEAIPG